MDHDHESFTEHRAKRRRWLIGLVVTLVTLLASPFLLLWYGSWSAGRRVEDQLRAIRDKNQPVTPVELNEFYAAPAPDADLTVLILDALRPLTSPAFGQAAQGLPVVGVSEDPIPPPGQMWEKLEAVEQLLQQYSASLKQLHAAHRKHGAARFPVDFQQGINTQLPHAQDLRAGARLLTLEAHVRAHRGDAHGAAESIQVVLSLADTLENEPIFISQLVRIAVHSMGYSLVRDLLPHAEFSDADLQALQLSVQFANCRQGLRRGLIGERVIGMHTFQNPGGAGIPPGPAVLIRVLGGGNQDLLLYLEFLTSMVDASERSWSDTRAAELVIDTKVKEIASSQTARLQHVLTMLVLPALRQASRAGMRCEAKQHLTDIAIAIERYRLKHARLPESLDVLMADYLEKVPLDPFDDGPMRFKSADGVILIYSVGADGIDNGGVEDAGKAEPDIVIRIGKPTAVNREQPE
jgi:hypothetical protein